MAYNERHTIAQCSLCAKDIVEVSNMRESAFKSYAGSKINLIS